MHVTQITGILAFFGLTTLLYVWSNNPALDSAAQHVLQTATWSLGIGTAVTTLCAAAVFVFRAQTDVEPGTEVGACVPYGIVSTAIMTRLHIFATGGYGSEEWSYVMNAPTMGQRWASDGVDGIVQKVLG